MTVFVFFGNRMLSRYKHTTTVRPSSKFPGTTVFNAIVLHERPNDFIVGCQPFIAKCVGYYSKKRIFSVEDKHDLIQSVNERLIMQLPKISKQYNGSSTLEAYISVVIHNTCTSTKSRPLPRPGNLLPQKRSVHYT
jgi:hypothetical protein